MGDIVEQREWIGTTRGQVVEVKSDATEVVITWHVGLRLAGGETTERAEDVRRLG